MLLDVLDDLLTRKDLRSADRASLERYYRQLKRGEPLSYQERQNLWAYIGRYHGPSVVIRG
jgi:hypothetical protein